MRDERCPDCGVVIQEHKPGCLTDAVERGEITPRQAQVLRYEANERLTDVPKLIHDEIAAARLSSGLLGGQIEKIVMGTDAFKRLATTVPNGGVLGPGRLDPAGMKYMGYDIVVDRSLMPDELHVVTPPPTKWNFTASVPKARP